MVAVKGSIVRMQEYCHRCGGELAAGSGESPFCPHCGAPQLTLAMENQSVETGGEPAAGAEGTASTGTLPPPRPRQVEWRTAIWSAALVAGIGGVLTAGGMQLSVLSMVSVMWMMSGSLIAMGIYQRRQPAAWIDVRVGARIGLLVGIGLTLAVGIALAGMGIVERFGMHAMGSFDAEMGARTQEAIRNASTPVPPEMLGFLASPEFRAGMMLAGFGFLAAMLLALSTLGGAFAGLLRGRKTAA